MNFYCMLSSCDYISFNGARALSFSINKDKLHGLLVNAENKPGGLFLYPSSDKQATTEACACGARCYYKRIISDN